jgi:hypothetical protein
MTKPLDLRLKALESRFSPFSELLTIVRTIVYLDGTQAEILSLRDEEGNKWQRQTGETDQALFDRVSFECARNAGGVASLSSQ